MKSSKNVLDSSDQLNISEMIQYGEEHININVRYFVKCRDYTELITHLMNIMNAFNEKKRLENRGKFVKLIIDFESINISSIDFEFVKTMINYLDTNYEEVITNIYCINVSLLFKMVYKILKPVLTKKVKEKIKFIKKGKNQELIELTEADFDNM